MRHCRLTFCRLLFAALSALGLAGCGEPHHELRPPTNVSAITLDPTPLEPPPPPPVPADCTAYDTAELYFWYPATLGVREVFNDPASYGRIVSLGPLPPTPKPAAGEERPAPAPGPAPAGKATDSPASSPTAPAPTASPDPNTPSPTPAPAPPPADPSPPAPRLPTTTTARVILLPGYPGDAFDRNLNGSTSLGLSMGTLCSQLFGNRPFSDFNAEPLAPVPGIAQGWILTAVDTTGRCHGFIVRSTALSAWCFALVEPGPDSLTVRDTLLRQLRVRLGQDQRFDDLTTDFRLDADIPATWKVPGPSTLSRRWDAPDALGFIIIQNGEPRGASVFRTCTAEDAREALARFPPVKEQQSNGALDIRAWDRFHPSVWAATGNAETTLDTLPHATTVGARVFYDPVARKKFCVYYGYQSDQRKQELLRMLGSLKRTALVP